MSSAHLEVADIFLKHGQLWRQKHEGHFSLGQLKVMSAIERCRTMALGGHKLRCLRCSHIEIAYNSCRNRHCPKCQATASHRWLEARQADLLPVEYFHVVFTVPSQVSELAYQNKSVIYGILFKAVTQTLSIIAGDKKHLGAKIGATLVLHTWGSAMMHHPHIHCIIPGGGLTSDSKQWVKCKAGYFLPVEVLSLLFKRLFLDMLYQAYLKKKLKFYNAMKKIESENQFFYWIKPLKKKDWVVYAKKPFAGPEAVLAYLARYTHRVAIANSRLISLKQGKVTFKYKEYRKKEGKQEEEMTLKAAEFMRRFLIHVLPSGFHRIRHIGLFANARRRKNLESIRTLLRPQVKSKVPAQIIEIKLEPIKIKQAVTSKKITYHCKKCGEAMDIIDTFKRIIYSRAPP